MRLGGVETQGHEVGPRDSGHAVVGAELPRLEEVGIHHLSERQGDHDEEHPARPDREYSGHRGERRGAPDRGDGGGPIPASRETP